MRRNETVSMLVGACLVSTSILAGTQGEARAEKPRTHRAEQVQERKAHVVEQKGENKEFRAETKDLKGAEKVEAIKEHRTEQVSENKAFSAQQHSENMTYLKDRLAKNTKLTDAQKGELTNFFEQQYQESAAFRDKQHSENIDFLVTTANDTSLTMVQKKAKIREYFVAQRAENKTHITTQRAETKTEVKEIRSEGQATATPGN